MNSISLFQLPSKVVKHSILSLVSMVLKRALKNIEYCLNEETWQKSEIYSLSTMQEFVQLYREAISKVQSKKAVGVSHESLRGKYLLLCTFSLSGCGLKARRWCLGGGGSCGLRNVNNW